MFRMNFTITPLKPPLIHLSSEAGGAARRCCSAASWRWRAGGWQDGPGNISETEQLLGDLYEHSYALERIITHYYYHYYYHHYYCYHYYYHYYYYLLLLFIIIYYYYLLSILI